jgi:sec-independent protein translocase protein TatB
MFDVGFSEVLLLGVIALLVLGPERLPKAARIFGGFVRKARRSFEGIKQEIEREIDADELKKSMAAMPTVASITEQIKAPFQEMSSAIDNERQSLNQGFDDMSKDVASVSTVTDEVSRRHPREGGDPDTASDAPEQVSDLNSRLRGNDGLNTSDIGDSVASSHNEIMPPEPSKPTAT